MAKLVLSMDGLVLKEIPLVKERMSIGRKPNNDIQIDNLAISGEHAVVVTILDDSFLEDLNSTNGTLVNGQPAKKHFLKNGDVIELGKYKLKYVVEQIPQYGATEFERSDVGGTNLTKSNFTTSLSTSTISATNPTGFSARGDSPLGIVEILNGTNAGRRLELTKTMTTLGKPGVQVAVIARRPDGYFITHVEGTLLPTINGEPVNGSARKLAENDVVEIAGTRMKFMVKR